jgi:hypothetical protein
MGQTTLQASSPGGEALRLSSVHLAVAAAPAAQPRLATRQVRCARTASRVLAAVHPQQLCLPGGGCLFATAGRQAGSMMHCVLWA